MVPSTPAPESAGDSRSAARRTQASSVTPQAAAMSGRRQRAPYRATAGSHPIPIITPESSGGGRATPASASRAAAMVQICCGRATARSFGGKRVPTTGSEIVVAQCVAGATAAKSAAAKSAAVRPAPTAAPIPTTAIGNQRTRETVP